MPTTCVTLTARKPTAAELDLAIKTFYSAGEKPGMQLITDALPIVGEACARLDAGARPEDVILALGVLGVDRECARTFVDMAARVLELKDNADGDACASTAASLAYDGGSMVSMLAALLVLGAIFSTFVPL